MTATTKVDTWRKPLQAMEKYTDAVFMVDDKPLYFGTDGDTKLQYSSTDGKLVISGADIRLSDTVKLSFGDADDATLSWDGAELDLTGVKLNYTSGDIQLSDTAELQLGNDSDCRITHDGTNTTIKNKTGYIGISGAGGDVRLSDTVALQIGDTADLTIAHDGTNTLITNATGYIGVSGAGADIRLSDTVQLIFGSTASSDCRLHYNNQANSDCLILTKGTSGLVKRATKSGCIFASDGFLKIVA